MEPKIQQKYERGRIMIYRIPAKVKSLEQKSRAVSAHKHPTIEHEIVWVRETIGWFVTFERSHESLFVGTEEPTDLKAGTEVDIIIVPEGTVVNMD
jgi:hypothetical protein